MAERMPQNKIKSSGVGSGIKGEKNNVRTTRHRVIIKDGNEYIKIGLKFNAKVYSQYKIISELMGTDVYLLIKEAMQAYLQELIDNGIANSLKSTKGIYFKSLAQYLDLHLYTKYNAFSEEGKKNNKVKKGVTYILINAALDKYLTILRRKYKNKEKDSLPPLFN